MFILIPQTPSMAPRLTQIYLDAFAPNAADRIMLPYPRSAATIAALEAEQRGAIEQALANPLTHFYLAIVDTSLPPTPESPQGGIVGSAWWKYHDPALETPKNPATANQTGPKWGKSDTAGIPGVNAEARALFFGGADEIRAQIIKERGWTRYWHLAFLATASATKGKGAGRVALQWGVDRAREDGLWTYVGATPEAKGFYQKVAGFETVLERKVEFDKWGVSDYLSAAMVKAP